MLLQIKTDLGKEAQIKIESTAVSTTAKLIDGDFETYDFAFIAPNAARLVTHFLNSEDTDFAVGVTGAKSITKAPRTEGMNHGHSLMSVLWKEDGEVMPLGELSPNYVPEITSTLMVSFQPDEEKVSKNLVTTVTGFELWGKVVEVKLISE